MKNKNRRAQTYEILSIGGETLKLTAIWNDTEKLDYYKIVSDLQRQHFYIARMVPTSLVMRF